MSAVPPSAAGWSLSLMTCPVTAVHISIVILNQGTGELAVIEWGKNPSLFAKGL
jgi:hypothetical protein